MRRSIAPRPKRGPNETRSSGSCASSRSRSRSSACAGVMPQSYNLEEFWDNLRNARDLVTEIPRDRWSWQDHDGNPLKEANKSNSRWGGFMKEVDKFDPLFFGITPREAEMMDPQQRIFLETVWHAIEDSGHKVSDLLRHQAPACSSASPAKDYIDVLTEHQMALDGYFRLRQFSFRSWRIASRSCSICAGPARPSTPLAPSSLIALHRAIESIHTGSSDMAIVGGVQVMLTPRRHISLSSAGMLSVRRQVQDLRQERKRLCARRGRRRHFHQATRQGRSRRQSDLCGDQVPPPRITAGASRC